MHDQAPSASGPDHLSHSAAPEITVRVIILGLMLSVIMGAANVYVGLVAGMTVSASIPAAVMAMIIFKLLSRSSSILEANQVQTCASAGESLAAGVIFTMPAMILIGYWTDFHYWAVTVIAMTGGLLGILFMIPMRRVFVVDNKDLKYPEGVACAAVLQAGESTQGEEETRQEAWSLVQGGILGAAFALLTKFFQVIAGTLEGATVIGSRLLFFGADLSPMLVAVGFIVRLHVAVLIFLGGALTWLIGIPLYGLPVGETESAVEAAYFLWSTQLRFVGVGAMVVGGFASLFSVRHGLTAALREMYRSLKHGQEGVADRERDLPAVAILVIGVCCVAMLALVNYQFTHGGGITALSTVVMLAAGFFFTAVASYIVGLVGNSNSPVSGMTITAVLISGGLMTLFRYSGMEAMVATLGVAAIVCCVACTSGDVCNDLKTGSLVGAAPRRQQFMQILGVLAAALVMAPVLELLHETTEGGIGGKELPAPQAGLFASLVKGMFAHDGALPWDKIAIGAATGVVILMIDWGLRKSGSTFRAHLMPIAVGMYLPFGIAPPILIGGLIAYWHSRRVAAGNQENALHRGVLFSSGTIAGEALTSVGLAILAALGVGTFSRVLTRTLGVSYQVPESTVTVLSLLAAAAGLALFFVLSGSNKDAAGQHSGTMGSKSS
ncbi:MAG: oligopeptide transporter, OPT family [Pirellulaceae bacterium]|nr:MAG: oligopeptide transporter, OPT family [Pirellulaceae bacterium]